MGLSSWRMSRPRVGASGEDLELGRRQDLTFSIVLQPQVLKASGQFMLAKLAALAVHDVVAGQLKMGRGQADEEVRIKWPNDVLVERRKIAGVLIRTEVQGERVTSAVVGIGLNVNSTELEAELGATSLRLETGREQDREALLGEICLRFEHHLATFRSGDQAWAASLYGTALRPWALGRPELDGEPFRARPVDVDEQGRLLVEDEAGGGEGLWARPPAVPSFLRGFGANGKRSIFAPRLSRTGPSQTLAKS